MNITISKEQEQFIKPRPLNLYETQRKIDEKIQAIKDFREGMINFKESYVLDFAKHTPYYKDCKNLSDIKARVNQSINIIWKEIELLIGRDKTIEMKLLSDI